MDIPEVMNLIETGIRTRVAEIDCPDCGRATAVRVITTGKPGEPEVWRCQGCLSLVEAKVSLTKISKLSAEK